jgi:hypothetical protein
MCHDGSVAQECRTSLRAGVTMPSRSGYSLTAAPPDVFGGAGATPLQTSRAIS